MKINEAVRKAIDTNTIMYRESVEKKMGRRAYIKPTNSYEACLMIICQGSRVEDSSRCWNPTADDLMADDWELVNIKV